jgi:hypothetical protein
VSTVTARWSKADAAQPESKEVAFEDSGPRSGPPDALVLDIGGDVGALVLYADERCLGREIDLTPVNMARSHHTHTLIRRRRASDRDIIAGVYPQLNEGEYIIWGLDEGGPIGKVEIVGGQVAEFNGGDCRANGPSSAGSICSL